MTKQNEYANKILHNIHSYQNDFSLFFIEHISL